MKKICVVTWYGGTNYGTNLQAYALYRYLECSGYDVELLGTLKYRENFFVYPVKIIKKIKNKLKSIVKENHEKSFNQNQDKYNSQKAMQKKQFCKFEQEYYKILNVTGTKEWKNVCNQFSCFITGSDQVWNPNYFNERYMLNFIKLDSIRKIAYGPSIGVEILDKKVEKRYKKLLKSYSAISVREEKAAILLKKLSPCEIKVVLDPTMLLDKKEWDYISEEASVESEWMTNNDYILCYFVGKRNDYWNYIKQIKDKTGYDVIVIPIGEYTYRDDFILAFNAGPKEFVWLVRHAKIVCTDSFHATVFSILYHKEFYDMKRFQDNDIVSQNGRLYNILSLFDLQNRLVINEKEFQRDEVIDYGVVDNILFKLKSESEEFLITAIEGR